MNNKKVTFIVCVNNEFMFEECLFYLNRLVVPDGFETDLIVIREADSMCAAYNAGMNSSDAKYKIYMHQDVMIRNTNFITDIVRIFKGNDEIGMIGVAGGIGLPRNAVTYRAWNVGKVDSREPSMAYVMEGNACGTQDVRVEAVDGLLIVTQYDVPWREDLFVHFDFYDVSQAFEMRRHGYKVVVPYQKVPWVIHDCNYAKLPYYDEARQIALKEYPEFFLGEDGYEVEYDAEWNSLCDMLTVQAKRMVVEHEWKTLGEVLTSYRTLYQNTGKKSSELEILSVLYNIYQEESINNVEHSFFERCNTYQEIYEKYMTVRFLLRRMELGMEPVTYEDLTQAIRSRQISLIAIGIISARAVVDNETVVEKLVQIR